MVLLWVVILRGVAIELRSRVDHPLWSAFWDTVFAGASATIAFVLGVALGNVVRGVPLDASGYFAAPLFADFRPSAHPGALDWYTLLHGGLAVTCVEVHAATYLMWKTSGPVRDRIRAQLPRGWMFTAAFLVFVTVSTAFVVPALFARFVARPWAWPLPIASVASAVLSLRATLRGAERAAFLGTSVFLASTLLAAAVVLFPTMLPSTLDPAFDLDAYNASTSAHGLALGLVWWIPALVLATGYFVLVFRSFRGKVDAQDYEH
jgi:cytochrome d ubiquinol oxidase subunit II